jgi:probable rRNA maturation factor
MSVDCLIEDKRWIAADLEGLAEAAAIATFAQLGLEGYEISLLGCNDARIAELNADFRGKPTPTNVLSWPSDERGAATDGGQPLPPDPADPELGDIAIAYETCAQEAESEGKSLKDHATHLVIHGILHLLGYDHDRDQDATLMEGLEKQILGNMGVANPYRGE